MAEVYSAEEADDESVRSSGVTIPDPISVTEHGRTFNAYRQGKYFLPNDGTEQSRLDLQHRAWKLSMDDALAWAPVEKIELANVLDIGTGTGVWAVEFAENHPQSQVFGTDLSLIQPAYVPPNCSFVREDSEEEWVFGFLFDYIHLRVMTTCFSDYRAMVKRAFDHIRPGGYIEYQELSLEATSDDPHTQHVLKSDPTSFQGFMNRAKEGSLIMGRAMDVTPKLKSWLIEAGFVDVVEKRIPVPLTPWPSDPKQRALGDLCGRDMHGAMEAAVKLLSKTSQPEETKAYIEACQNNLKDMSLKIYHTWVVVYGRKPNVNELPR